MCDWEVVFDGFIVVVVGMIVLVGVFLVLILLIGCLIGDIVV